MTHLSHFRRFACLLVLCAVSAAQDVQKQANNLLARAMRLSDIRSASAPAFQLQATFSFTGEKLEEVQGTYTETWISKSRWRKETVVGDSRKLEISNAGKIWVAFPEDFPARADNLPLMINILSAPFGSLLFDSISEQKNGNIVAQCAFTKAIAKEYKVAFCFEKNSGLLLQKAFPEKRVRKLVNFSCEYGTFRKFGAFWFPREVECFDDRHKVIGARIVELREETSPDASLFVPPPEAVEFDRCEGKVTYPQILNRELDLQVSDPDRVTWLKVWFVINGKGRAHDWKVLGSSEKRVKERAVNTVRNLSFKPATCDGRAISLPTSMEIPVTGH